MTYVRRILILVVMLAVGGVIGRVATAGSATLTTYTLTISGSDAHSLDPRVGGIFVTGGGVEPVNEPSQGPTTLLNFEAGLNLPVGAKVTAITVDYSYCDDPRAPVSFVFKSYAPVAANTVVAATLTGAHCGRADILRLGNPITTVAAGRRYVIDYLPSEQTAYPGARTNVFYGAVVKYTCTSPCVP
jgi:hypothetical protein